MCSLFATWGGDFDTVQHPPLLTLYAASFPGSNGMNRSYVTLNSICRHKLAASCRGRDNEVSTYRESEEKRKQKGTKKHNRTRVAFARGGRMRAAVYIDGLSFSFRSVWVRLLGRWRGRGKTSARLRIIVADRWATGEGKRVFAITLISNGAIACLGGGALDG